MKKVWKWIIGIVLGLIVLAALVGAGIMMSRFRGAYQVSTDGRQGFSNRGNENLPYGGFDHFRGPGMMGNGGWGPGMMGHGFNPLGGLIGGLFCLAFLALAVMGVIWLVNRLRTHKMVSAPVAAVVETPAALTHPCQKCGEPLQEGWKVCPHCGKKV